MSDDDFIVTPKDKTVTISIRIDRTLSDKLVELAKQSNRSRNELINMALEHSLKNVKFIKNTNSNKDERD